MGDGPLLKAMAVKVATMANLRATADQVRREVMAREDVERADMNRAAVGKYFKYRNCYSCPEKPSDYWWLFARVESLGENGWPVGWSFQVDKDGALRVESLQHITLLGQWVEISAREFYAEWAKVLAKLKARANQPRRRAR